MTTWYSKELGDGAQASAPSWKIQEAFMALAMQKQLPYDLAVFSEHDHRRNTVTAYFSPAAKLLAEIFGAQPCDPPQRSSRFGLLVGDARAWDLLFPQK